MIDPATSAFEWFGDRDRSYWEGDFDPHHKNPLFTLGQNRKFSTSAQPVWNAADNRRSIPAVGYKNVDAVVEVAEKAGLARRVARLKPVICIKG